MNFINNLTALFPRVGAAVQSRPVFRGTPAAAAFESDVKYVGDSYTSNPVYDMLGSREDMLKAAQSSEVIRNRCKEYGIPFEMNFDVLEDM
jgi:hypothetical protein